ncbi:hypothetical protein QQF64_004986 [Cirrhinus molitorella]|uniref:Uncharacterized protein n=1 Tax=Cirrhinus molitorella TaxID=172907 RepID=A0ABR3MJU7_9TELE
MGHGLTDCSFVLKTRGREEKKEEGPNECEEKAETSQIPQKEHSGRYHSQWSCEKRLFGGSSRMNEE